MSAQNNALRKCARGLNCSWRDFDWSQYPRGVKVVFPLIRSNQLMLVKPTRWSYDILSQYLTKDGTLAEALSKMHAELARIGVRVSTGGKKAKVIGVTEIKETFNVLVMVPVVLNSSADQVEFVSDSIMLSGLASEAVKKFIPGVLKWKNPDYMFDLENQKSAA